MSGGSFDYDQYRIGQIADQIEQEVRDNGAKPDWWVGEWDGRRYSDETMAEFRKGVWLLRKAEVYAQRIDWLLAGDDGEDTFHERLKEDLERIERAYGCGRADKD